MLTNVVAFIFVLGVLIFVHELGHFVMARRIGVRVLTFSLGFGPKLLRVRRGDTEYCVSAIPLGGYVKMAGEHAEDNHAGQPDEFLSKTKWERFQVLIAGPAMNILLAIVVMALVLYQGAEVPAYESQPPVVGTVLAGSPAERAGIQPGDRLVSIAGRGVDTWEQLFLEVMPKANREIEILVERDGAERRLAVVPDAQTKFEMGDIGVLPEMHPQIRVVTPGGAADRAGLLAGDVILAVNGEAMTRDQPLVKTINESAGVPLTLRVRRDAGEQDIVVTPVKQGDVGLIGVQLSQFEVRIIEPGPLQAIQMSLQRNLEWSTLIFRTLVGLFTTETSPRQLMGPVAIAQLSGGAAQVGWVALFSLMAMISLNLGILNLMPIPVLDGGHIMILALEGVTRRDFSVRLKEKMLFAGFLVLMLLMVTVIYNDLTRIEWIERFMFWR
ncbi:MAG: RIP metalloprotease RseP [Acidobacteria bacterium]|nr:RIP metalloprotease RseP [Acidobacteriota bacterium]